jgi:hypothetical protein
MKRAIQVKGLSLKGMELVRDSTGDIQVFVDPKTAYVPLRIGQKGDFTLPKKLLPKIKSWLKSL